MQRPWIAARESLRVAFLLGHFADGIARRVEKLEGKVDMHETDIRLILDDVRQLKRKKSIPEDPIPPAII